MGAPSPQAVNGILDLRGHDLSRSPVDLRGDWEFFPDQLKDPGAPGGGSKAGRIARLPSSWERLGGDTGRLGCGTFRLTVLVDTSRLKQVAIEAPAEQTSAYVLWMDDKILLRRGVVGPTPRKETMESRHGFASAPLSSGRIELVLQASNHTLDYEGKILRFKIGERRSMEQAHARWLMVYMGCIGILLIFSIQYLGFLTIGMRERTYLQFGAFCLLWLTACINESGQFSFMTMLFGDVPFRFTILATFASVAIALALVGRFCHEMFPNPVLAKANRIHAGITAILVASLLLLPFSWSFRIFAIVVVFGFLEVGVLSYSLILAIRRGMEGSIVFSVGFALFMAATAHDGLVFIGAIDSSYLMLLGGSALAVAEAFALAKRFLSVHRTNTHLLSEVREKNAELARLNRLKDDFLANTSHELRTPLHGILGLSQSILSDTRERISNEVRRNLEYIAVSARRMTGLVNDILDFSRLRHQELVLKKGRVDLAAVLPSIMPHFRHTAKTKGLTLQYTLEPDLPEVVADEDRLLQILFNLVGNAVKFTDAGDVLVSAYLRGGRVEVSVADTGIGISAESMSRIFEPFEQGDGGYRGGTGLGLSITRKLVELHGAYLSVDSTPGKGTRFHFELAIADEAIAVDQTAQAPTRRHEPPVQVTNAEDTGEVGAQSVIVLAIDDEPLNLMVLQSLLKARGIAVVTAPDGRNATELIEKHEPALVLLDVMMPHLDGYEVCAEIRRRWSPTELPILFLSARSRLEDLVKGFAAGGNDYVLKPFLGQELIARVEAQMRQRDAFVTLKENQYLKVELAETVLERRKLESARDRLLGLFNGMEEPILILDGNRETRFANRSLLRLLDLDSASDTSMSCQDILVDTSWPPDPRSEAASYRLRKRDGQTIALPARISQFSAEDETLWVLAGESEAETPRNRGVSRLVLQELSNGETRLARLRSRLQELEGAADTTPPLEDFHATLSQIRTLVSDRPEKEQMLLLASEALNEALELWTAHTGKGKADLAEESGQWAVHPDMNGWRRTVTLDKYLDPNKIPRFPKWKNISKTIEFTLSRIPPSEASKELREKAIRISSPV